MNARTRVPGRIGFPMPHHVSQDLGIVFARKVNRSSLQCIQARQDENLPNLHSGTSPPFVDPGLVGLQKCHPFRTGLWIHKDLLKSIEIDLNYISVGWMERKVLNGDGMDGHLKIVRFSHQKNSKIRSIFPCTPQPGGGPHSSRRKIIKEKPLPRCFQYDS